MVLHRASGNAAILPGSVLPYRSVYQQCADNLPAGAILIVLPAAKTPQRRALETVALQLQGAGHRVTTMVADLDRRGAGIQALLPLAGV